MRLAPPTWPMSATGSSHGSTPASRRSSPISGRGSNSTPDRESGTLPGRRICDASTVMDETVTQVLLAGQDAVLAGIAAGAPTESLLQTITEMVERCLPGVRCTVRVGGSGGTEWDDASRSMPVLLDDQVVASIETLGGL